MLPQETVSHDDIHAYPLIPWKEVMCPEHETTRSRLHPSSCQLSLLAIGAGTGEARAASDFPALLLPTLTSGELFLFMLGHAMWASHTRGFCSAREGTGCSGSLPQCGAGLHHIVKHPSLLQQARHIWSWGCCVFSIPWHLSLKLVYLFLIYLFSGSLLHPYCLVWAHGANHRLALKLHRKIKSETD